MTFYDIFVQAIGFVAIIFVFLAFQNTKHHRIMFFRIITASLFGLQFFLLHAYTAFAANVIAVISFVVFAWLVKKGISTVIPTIIVCLALVIFGILTWDGPVSLLSMVGTISVEVASSMKNVHYNRRFQLLASVLWIINNVIFLSLAGILGECLTISSIFISFFRELKQKKALTIEEPEKIA